MIDPRIRSATPVILLVLAVCALAGALVGPIVARGRGPLDRARSLTRTGRFAEAEQAYLELAGQRPASLPVIIELLDNHAALVVDASPGALDAPVDAVLAAPDLPPGVALLGRWWLGVLRGRPRDDDASAVLAAALADPPLPWANHLLGREARHEDDDERAAELFAREATAFDDRRGDANAACQQWIEDEAWPRLREALSQPRFARQVSAGVRMQDALRRRDWGGVARWFFPSQYEGATVPILLLAAISACVWFALCAVVGRARDRLRVRAPLFLAAFVLGIGSTYVTMALAIAEQRFLGLAEKGQAVLDLIYFVVGVGVREELSKALLFLPLLPALRRWGSRRESLACGALVGLGFAAEENVGYFHMGLSTALSRFLTANFLHISTTGLVAVAVDDAVRGREVRAGDLSRTLMLVVVAHGLYDFFLSTGSADTSFLSMFVFVLLTRRFVDVIRSLPGREGPLARWFLVGLAVVAGSSFVYASALVGPGHAATALLEGMFGMAIVAFVFVRELGRV
jgi:RsiW-degrading membrane proteinase PrsW (M82 family)